MAKRRPSGDGAIRQRENGRWEGRYVVGHKNDGTPIFRYVYASTQKGAAAKLRQAIQAAEGIELTEGGNMTLAQWLDRWLEDLTGTIRESTRKRYRQDAERYIIPYLGHKKLSRITPTDIQTMYAKLKNEGRILEHPKYGKRLSDTTVHGIHIILKSALSAAERSDLIADNPAEHVVAPKCTYTPKQILNNTQLDAFMDIIQQDPFWRDLFYTEMTTGLRRGELCALKWEDFEPRLGTLTIRRSLSRGSIGDTKTYASTRKIVLPPSTAQLLSERKKSAVSEWIFPNPLHPERPINPNHAYRQMKTFLAQANLPSIRFHDLRHTFATHALSSGVDAKTLSGILGHTKASFTLDTYTHVTGDMQKQAAQVVGGFLTEYFGEELKPWQNDSSAATDTSV